MSTAVMALAETSKSYQKRINELEAEVARLQGRLDDLNHDFGLHDFCHQQRVDRDADRIIELQKDLAQARGYGHALYKSMYEHALQGPEGLTEFVPKPPWLDGE